MLRLIIEDDEGKTTVVPLIRDEITIGRKEGNTIRLTERNVSRRHARLMRAGESGQPSVIVEDLDSNNGVRLNGDRIAGKCMMRPGDLVQIGDYSLALQYDAPTGLTGDNSAARPEEVGDAQADGQTQVRSLRPEDDVLPEEQRGRLVVVSSNLGGTGFELGRREVIIGRTDENDVVVNHRSISRNHAKIVVRDSAFTIIDLASSNGVKVNGEQFGTVTLVNGDIIELGHVKLRFVSPGKTYVFTQADIDDVAVESSTGTGKLVIIAVLFAAVVAGTFLLLRKSTTPGAQPPVVASTVSAAPPTTATQDAPVDVKQLVVEAQGHLQREDFSAAERVFDRVLQASPENAEAIAGRATAQTEAKAQAQLRALQAQVKNGEWAEAYLSAVEFPAESRYAAEAARLKAEAEPKFAAAELRRGLDLVASGELEGARAVQQDLARRGFSEASKLSTAVKSADSAKARESGSAAASRNAASPKPDVTTTPTTPPPERKGNPSEDATGSSAEYSAMMDEAMKLTALGKRDEAATLFERAHKLRPRDKVPSQRLCAIYPNMGKQERALYHCKKWLEREQNPSQKAAIELKIDQLKGEMK